MGTRPPNGGVAPQGRTLWPISKIFYTTNYPALFFFYIWRDSLHRLRSYCWETARPSFSPKFFVHPVGKTELDRKMMATFLMVSTSSMIVQSLGGGDRTTRAGWRCENMVFVCFLCVCYAPVAGAMFVRRVHSSNMTCSVLQLMGRFWCGFRPFFRIDSPSRRAAQFSFSSLDFATIFAKVR